MNEGLTLPSAGHRERKKQNTKRRLSEAALQLFENRGYEQTRIEDIAAACELVPRTFFRYFCSKDDALLGWYDSLRDVGVAEMKARPRGEGIVTAVIAAIRASAQIIDQNAKAAEIAHRLCASSPELALRRSAQRSATLEALSAAAAGRVRPSAALVARMLTAAIITAQTFSYEEWHEAGMPGTLTAFSQPAMRKALKAFESIEQQYVLQ